MREQSRPAVQPPDRSPAHPDPAVKEAGASGSDTSLIALAFAVAGLPPFALFIVVAVWLLSGNVMTGLFTAGLLILLLPVIGLAMGIMALVKKGKMTAMVASALAIVLSLISLSAFGIVYMRRSEIVSNVESGIAGLVSSQMEKSLAGGSSNNGSGATGSDAVPPAPVPSDDPLYDEISNS
jgi:hypothetical protein